LVALSCASLAGALPKPKFCFNYVCGLSCVHSVTLHESGVTLATHIFNNSTHQKFSRFASTASESKTPSASSPREVLGEDEVKRLLYRALMLKGMACLPPSNQRNQSNVITCEKAREMVLEAASGNIQNPPEFASMMDRSLQIMAYEQVCCALISCLLHSFDLLCSL
jgi:hypothetical protein